MIALAVEFAAIFIVATLATTVLASLVAGYLDQRRERQQDQVADLTPAESTLLHQEHGGTFGWLCTCGAIGHGFHSARTALGERRIHRANCPAASIQHYDARRPH